MADFYAAYSSQVNFFSPPNLKSAGFKPSDLLQGGYLYQDLWGQSDLTNINQNTATNNYTVNSFLNDSTIHVTDLKTAGFSLSVLYNSGNGYHLVDLYNALFSLSDFHRGGISIDAFYNNGLLTSSYPSNVNVTVMFNGYPKYITALDLYNAGYTDLSDLKTLGHFTISDLKNIMDSIQYRPSSEIIKLYNLGYTFAEIVSAGFTSSQIFSSICFPAKTPVKTDQGYVHIDQIDKRVHTIRGEKIVAITKTVSKENHLVCIKKNALGKNMPSQKTYITKGHCVLYKGKMVRASQLVSLLDNGLVEFVEYTGEPLYNVLLEEHSKMIVNNMICETLHPENGVALIHRFFKFDELSEIEKCMFMSESARAKKNISRS